MNREDLKSGPWRRTWVGLCVAFVVGGSAHAGQLTLTYQHGYYTGGDSGLAGYDKAAIANTYTGNAYSTPIAGEVGAGADLFEGSGTTLQAYCVDVGHALAGAGTAITYNVLSDSDPTTLNYFQTLGPNPQASGTSIVQEAEHLASNWLGQVTNVDQSAAFQIALWDIAFNNGLATSTFTATANGTNAATVNGLVSTYLGNLSGPISEQLTFLQDPLNNSQNLVTFTPVPLPAAGWLLLSGISALLVLGRRRALPSL
jgi:hypothetical protein